MLISVTKNFVAPKFWMSKVGQRIMPILPLVYGLGLAFLGVCDCAIWQDKLVIGLIAGWASSHTFKLGKTSVLGWGVEDSDGDGIPDAPATPVVPAAAPAVVAPVVPVVPAATDTKPADPAPAATAVTEKKE